MKLRQDELDELMQSTPIGWRTSATYLLVSAEHLRKHAWQGFRDAFPDLRELFLAQELMLRGFALECVLKGTIVQREPGVLADPKTARELMEHALKAHAERAGLVLSDEEKAMLSVLTEFITWRGRYPCPRPPERVSRKRWPEAFSVLLEGLFRRVATSGGVDVCLPEIPPIA